MPKDSIPLINSEIEVGEIVKQPVISTEEKNIIKDKLNKLRDEIIAGKDFAAMAVLYSEDPGSAKKGGELGFVSRGELYPEFEAVAFGLKGTEISQVIETKAGFHIIQFIERRGDRINVRHILMVPQVSADALLKAKNALDTVYTQIQSGIIKFADAALKYSDDPSKNNNGIMVNAQTSSSKFPTDDLDPSVFFVVDKLKVGEISKPVPMKTADGKQAYRILYLKSRTEPHRANLKEDYSYLQNRALISKQNEEVEKWIEKKVATTYIHINDDYKKCIFKHKWF
jgi:peptidyl-prolyl cis-trans isomerase SurA